VDFDARTHSVDGTEVVQISGELDLATVPRLEEALADRGGRVRVVVDAAALTFVDVVGVEALVRCHSRLASAGGALLVTNPPPLLRRVLELTGLEGSLPVDAG
jgi:anti-anti-sigma factor